MLCCLIFEDQPLSKFSWIQEEAYGPDSNSLDSLRQVVNPELVLITAPPLISYMTWSK